ANVRANPSPAGGTQGRTPAAWRTCDTGGRKVQKRKGSPTVPACSAPGREGEQRPAERAAAAEVDAVEGQDQAEGGLGGVVAVVDVEPVAAVLDRRVGVRGRLVAPGGVDDKQPAEDALPVEDAPVRLQGGRRQPAGQVFRRDDHAVRQEVEDLRGGA